MKLVKPTKKYGQGWCEALSEFREEKRKGFWNREKEPDSLDDYIKMTKDHEKGKNISKDWAPATTYWLIDKGKFIGHTNIRHKLNAKLRKIGGNIGYYIRPSERNKGYGTQILKLALIKAKKLGLKKMLITCAESNIASKKIIEKNKGRFKNKVADKNGNNLRYWIGLGSQP